MSCCIKPACVFCSTVADRCPCADNLRQGKGVCPECWGGWFAGKGDLRGIDPGPNARNVRVLPPSQMAMMYAMKEQRLSGEPGGSAAESGLTMVASNRSFDETLASLKQQIQQAQLAIVFEANHKNMMALVGIDSAPSVTVGFARPQMGHMVLSAEPRASIDMPLRAAVRQLDDGSVVVIYYPPSYLFGMWKNDKLQKPAMMADMMVQKFVAAATDNGKVLSVTAKEIGENLHVVESRNSFDQTVARLKEAVQHEKLAIVFETNHKNMMALVGLESRPSITIGFARPQMGHMVMSAEPRAAIEMPLRVSIRELDNGDVAVIYFDPAWLFSHYENPKLQKPAAMASMMVGKFVQYATAG